MKINLTAEEKKRINPEAIRSLIKADREKLNNNYRNDHKEIEEEIKELESLLENI